MSNMNCINKLAKNNDGSKSNNILRQQQRHRCSHMLFTPCLDRNGYDMELSLKYYG